MSVLSNYRLVTSPMGGEIVRIDNSNSDGTARKLTTSGVKDDVIAVLPDLGTGLTKTIWSAATSTLTSPSAVCILIDPENTYDDDLDRDSFAAGKAPCITFEISTADAVAGVLVTPSAPANEAVIFCVDCYREFEFGLPSCAFRAAITTATQTRALSKIRARNNCVSGFGSILIRGSVF